MGDEQACSRCGEPNDNGKIICAACFVDMSRLMTRRHKPRPETQIRRLKAEIERLKARRILIEYKSQENGVLCVISIVDADDPRLSKT